MLKQTPEAKDLCYDIYELTLTISLSYAFAEFGLPSSWLKNIKECFVSQ